MLVHRVSELIPRTKAAGAALFDRKLQAIQTWARRGRNAARALRVFRDLTRPGALPLSDPAHVRIAPVVRIHQGNPRSTSGLAQVSRQRPTAPNIPMGVTAAVRSAAHSVRLRPDRMSYSPGQNVDFAAQAPMPQPIRPEATPAPPASRPTVIGPVARHTLRSLFLPTTLAF